MTATRLPTAYIHIGPHKTGSSSIQHFVRENEQALAGLGLSFPKLAASTSGAGKGHIDLVKARELKADGGLKPGARLWPEIEALTARGTDILLSSEMFTKALREREARDPIVAFFRARSYRVVLIAYVRDQPGWLNSWYVQTQKKLYRLESFDDFEASYGQMGRVDPARYLRPYRNDPGLELVVVPFEQAIRSGLERDFIARCGVVAPVGGAGLRNPNAGAKTVFAAQEIMRRAGPGLRELEGYGLVYRSFKKRCAEAGWASVPYVALDAARTARIRERYAASNEKFAREVFDASWDELAPPRDYAPSVFDPASASRGELAEIEDVVAETTAKLVARGARGRAGGRLERAGA